MALVVLTGWASAGTSHAQPIGRDEAMAAAAPPADPGTESQFIDRINSLRTSKGLRQLQPSGELTGVARSWTDRMVSNGQISHNPNLGSQVSGGWTKLGENVGVGYDVAGLMEAFINSPAHYRNLVDPAWTHVGVGVTFGGDGRTYTTHNFMALPGGGAPPPPPPPAADPDHLAAHDRGAAPTAPHHHDDGPAAGARAHRGPRHRGPRAAAIPRTAVRERDWRR